MDANEPGAAVLALFAQIIDRVKQTTPMRSDDKPLKGGRVYSMLALGMPVNPADWKDPWNPQGAAPPGPVIPPPPPVMNPSSPNVNVMTAPGTTPPGPTQAEIDEAARAMKAAFNISKLSTMLLSVTDDQTYQEYPDGRAMDYSYPAILQGIHPIAADEPDDPAVVAAVKKANAVLFLPNPDGTSSVNPTPMYQNYQNNTQNYGIAVGNYATGYAAARLDPNQMAVFPTASRPLQIAVTQARQTLIAQGAAQVEAALDALATVGYPYQAHLVAAAQASYQDWSVSLGGQVSALSPYSQILPSDWASDDPGACNGWETLSIASRDYSSIDVSSARASSQFSWFNKASSTGGSGNASLFGFVKLGGSGGSSSSSQGSGSSGNQSGSNQVYTDAKSLTIKMTYALCTLQRPWFAGDLFYMQDWYMKGAEKNSISTGNIEDQMKLPDQLMPMVTQQMLVIRDVTISALSWGSIHSDLTSAYGASAQSSSTSGNSEAGSAGVSLGFISFGASASHASSKAQGSGWSVSGANSSDYVGTTFDGTTLRIPGAQIMGYLCDITPASAPVDDPEYGKTDTSAASSSTSTSNTTTAATPQPVGAAS